MLGLVDPRLRPLSCFGSVSQIAWRKTKFPQIKERSCSLLAVSNVHAVRKTNLITLRACKYKRIARMLANSRKEYSIPLKDSLLKPKFNEEVR